MPKYRLFPSFQNFESKLKWSAVVSPFRGYAPRYQQSTAQSLPAVKEICKVSSTTVNYSDKLGWSTLYMKIKMKVHNYEVFFNRFRQRWMNFFLFILLWFLLKKHSKRLFYCILLRRKLIKLLILESNIS